METFKSHSVVLFVVASSLVSVIVVMSSVAVRIVTVSVTVAVVMPMVVRRSDRHLEVVPRHVSEDSVLDVASEVPLLGQGVSVLLGVHSPSRPKLSF